jgi:hypothetical protein
MRRVEPSKSFEFLRRQVIVQQHVKDVYLVEPEPVQAGLERTHDAQEPST